MNRTILNGGLLLIAIGLGVAVWTSGNKDDDKSSGPLTSLAPAAVDKISIEHPGAPAIKLEKRDGEWKLVAPVQADTDSFEVSALVGLADTKRQSELTDNALDYKSLGLDPPAFRITLNDQTLDFGGDEPIRYRRYVRVNGDKVALIDNPASAALDKDYSDLMSKSIVPLGAQITKLALPGLTIEKNAAGEWASPEHPQAKPIDLQTVVDAWNGAKAMWNGAELAQGSQGDAAAVTLADGRTLNFIVTARTPQFVLSRPDLNVRYTIDKNEVSKMLELPKPGEAKPAVETPLPESTGETGTPTPEP